MWRVDDAESILRREVVVVLGESAAGAERVRLSPLIVPAAAPGVVELTAPHLGRPLFQLDGNGVVLVLAARGRLHLTDVLELRIRPQQLTGEDGRTGAERSGAGHAEERVRHRPPQRGRVPLSACV